MSQAAKRHPEIEGETVRVLGRGLRAQRGVHLTLRTLREAAGKTQIEIKEISGIDQADISRLEGREDFDDYQISTLRRYVGAIGGQLELVASFDDKRIVLSGLAARASEKTPAMNKALPHVGRKAPRR